MFRRRRQTSARDVKNGLKQHLGDSKAVPPQHVIVDDEAQRAWDLEQVTAKHSLPFPKSEPEAFVDCGRPRAVAHGAGEGRRPERLDGARARGGAARVLQR